MPDPNPDRTRIFEPEARAHDERRDFAAAGRLPGISAIAAVVGAVSALAGSVLAPLLTTGAGILPLAAAKSRFQSLTGSADANHHENP